MSHSYWGALENELVNERNFTVRRVEIGLKHNVMEQVRLLEQSRLVQIVLQDQWFSWPYAYFERAAKL